MILNPFYLTDYKGYELRSALIVSLNQLQTDPFKVAFISTIIPKKTSYIKPIL